MNVGRRWTAIVLAGERPGGDPLAREYGVMSKAAIPLAGRAMIDHVVDALLASPQIERVVIMAQDTEAIKEHMDELAVRDDRIHFAHSSDGIAMSVKSLAGSEIAPWPVMVTTADNALLTPARIETFLNNVGESVIAVGVSERSSVEAMYPKARRTWLKFRDGEFSGANLFALSSPTCVSVLDHWSAIESDRKKGWKLIASFGPWLFLQVALLRLTFADAIDRAGMKLGCTAKPIVLDAEASIDVDKIDDYALVAEILASRR